MANEKIFENLPDDPEQAFLLLEEKFREDCLYAASQAGQNDDPRVHYVDYIAQVLAAIDALGLESAFFSEVPRIENVDYNTYLNFSKDVKHYTTQLRILHSRRAQGFSVRFDAAAKSKIHHFINQMRDFLQKLELDTERRESLTTKLNAFGGEVDRERTRLEAWGNFAIEVAGIAGEAAEKLEPMRKWVDSVARLIWGAQSEQKPILPAPTERKRIEPPQKAKTKEEDDEIPF